MKSPVEETVCICGAKLDLSKIKWDKSFNGYSTKTLHCCCGRRHRMAVPASKEKVDFWNKVMNRIERGVYETH